MLTKNVLVTGATGFVGGHVAEACVVRGYRVSALARPGSDTSLLEQAGVTIHRGDLTEAETVVRATNDVEIVIHCAAKVGDWDPVEAYRQVNVEGLRILLDVCRGKALQSFIHLSSLGVYAARDHHGTDETAPLPNEHVDGYTQSKVEAERLALQYQRDFQVPVVVLRPGFIYGPRDRTVLPRLIASLRARKLRYFGGGQQALNTIYVGNLVEAVLLALANAEAVGRVYNLTDGEAVSKRRFIGTLALALGLPEPRSVPVPVWLARVVAQALEQRARRRDAAEPPRLTQASLKFIALHLDFSIERARRELGYRPRFTFEQGMEETLGWLKEQVADLAHASERASLAV